MPSTSTSDTWLETGARCWADLSTGLLSGGPGPITPFLPPAEASGLKGQAYGMGAWRCARPHAGRHVLEFEPPACRPRESPCATATGRGLEFGVGRRAR
ncbi:MAG: hypothetical protein U5R31_03305 [Acidimicrobiia bacterium]|nr:hypothetical protein [Acidimicrobiia bacterium]